MLCLNPLGSRANIVFLAQRTCYVRCETLEKLVLIKVEVRHSRQATVLQLQLQVPVAT